MKFKLGEPHVVYVRWIRIGNVIIEMGHIAQTVNISEGIEEHVDLVRQTLHIRDSQAPLKIDYSDGQHWLKRT